MNFKGINIERRDNYTYLKYSDGVKMKWDDGMVVYLTLDKSYMGKTSGICGNFNQETSSLNKMTNIFLKN